MENNALSGIERELVLQYLIDGNVPVTLTPEANNSENKTENIHSVPSQIFPIALKPEHIHVQKNGKIHLENQPLYVNGFEGKNVRVEFYFNRVGLYFNSVVNKDEKGLYILIPESINRIKDVEDETDYEFSALLYFECKNKKEIDRKCIPWKYEELFTRPAWKSIPLNNQKKAKEYLENFVENIKQKKNAGNGIQLIPVCNFLTFEDDEKIQAMENRLKPLNILYVDHERIVLGSENASDVFEENNEYGVKLSFTIKNSPILSRDIYVTCIVNNVYTGENPNKKCVDLAYTTIQEEDLRYLFEKATKRLFI